ncbi:MAG: tyrosine-protein phosphatase [SAR324 cluster bacterium]|nr:tyrosine-protein phosphatase [SAR324 cluster bacterium]
MRQLKKIITDISIVRVDESRIKISWIPNHHHGFISIYQACSADLTASLKLLRKTKEDHLILTDSQNAVRYYYLLVPDNSPGVWVGQRHVAMSGMVNFRDMGGYQSKNGKQTKWGLLFRGDSLQRATDMDLLLIKQMNVGLVFDFRRLEEVQNGPNRFPENHPLEYQQVPISHGEFNFVSALEKLKKNELDTIQEETIIKGYIKNTEKFAVTWGKVIKRLAMNDCPPLFFHCTAGKDRTGICAALILSTLQIPRATIMSDYLLSNEYIKDVWAKFKKVIAKEGVNPEKMKPFFTAPEYAMTALLDYLEKTYGSVLDFLKVKADLSAEIIEEVRERLLE